MAQAFTSGYQVFAFSDFSSGLNLRDKADVVTDKEAIDLLNVTFNERGAIRQRDGYADVTTGNLTNRVDSLAAFYTAAGTHQLIAGCGTRLEAITVAGAVVASKTGLAGGPYSFARFADPAHEYLYAANGADVLQRWDGATWTTGATSATVNGTASSAMPKPGSIAVTAVLPGSTSGTNAANRLVSTAYGVQTTAGPGGTASTPSRVHFSNAGQPEAWETDGASGRGRNFLDLTPGDGEQIMAAVAWRELVFIFKETKFFILWGESPAADGTPVFNIREVVTGVGLAAKQAVTVGREGVYFMSRNGVYVTNGGEPNLLSDKISPIWAGAPEVYFQSSTLNLAQLPLARMAWHAEQLYVAIPTGSSAANDRVLVYDTQHQWWSLWDLPAAALVSFLRSDQAELHLGYSTGNNRVGRVGVGLTNDLGANQIVSRWRSGWSDYDMPLVKTIRESKLWASGAVTVSFSQDFNKAFRYSDTVIFGSSTATWPGAGTWGSFIASINGVWPGAGQINDQMVRHAIQGTTFSTQFANNSASPTWAVHRVARHMRETRGASVL